MKNDVRLWTLGIEPGTIRLRVEQPIPAEGELNYRQGEGGAEHGVTQPLRRRRKKKGNVFLGRMRAERGEAVAMVTRTPAGLGRRSRW